MAKWSITITGEGEVNNSYERFAPFETETDARDRKTKAYSNDADAIFRRCVAELRGKGRVVLHAALTYGHNRITLVGDDGEPKPNA